MKKKLISILLAGAVMASLSGCGAEQAKSESSKQTETATRTEETTKETEYTAQKAEETTLKNRKYNYSRNDHSSSSRTGTCRYNSGRNETENPCDLGAFKRRTVFVVCRRPFQFLYHDRQRCFFQKFLVTLIYSLLQ